jgi:hypothetical protein
MKQNLVVAVMLMVMGCALRLGANAMAWPNNLSYSGPREATAWAIREAAINDIGMGFFYLGGILLVGGLLLPFLRNTGNGRPNQPSEGTR